MPYTGQDKVKLFAENTRVAKREFIWQSTLTKQMAALLYAQEGKAVDCEAVQQCLTLIKQNTGIFSTFRGNMTLCLATLLALSPHPQESLDEALKVYDLLKKAKFHASDYLVIAAYQIASQSGAPDREKAVARARSFYDGMKADHFFYTGEDDYIFATMLGLADLDVSSGVRRIEELFVRLKDEFWDKNSVQTLVQVLALGTADDSVTARVLALRDALRAQGIKLDKTYTLPILGILALLPVEIDQIVRDLDAAQEALRSEKGFGSLSISTQQLLLFAASLVAGEYADQVKDGSLTAALSTSITHIILAQQAAMIAAISASTAAAASASS